MILTGGWYPRTLCHEMAHANGWAMNHPGGSFLSDARAGVDPNDVPPPRALLAALPKSGVLRPASESPAYLAYAAAKDLKAAPSAALAQPAVFVALADASPGASPGAQPAISPDFQPDFRPDFRPAAWPASPFGRSAGFIADLKAVVEELRKDGMSFKMKARLQAEELLKTSWRLIHSNNDDVPPNVKADLIKFTIRAAGLDGSKDQAAAGSQSNALQININL
jgi:hypothetical protein